MTTLQKFTTNFNQVMESSKQADGSMKLPFMIKISQSMADDPELAEFLGLQNGRAEYLGVVINAMPDMQVYKTYEDAFPGHD